MGIDFTKKMIFQNLFLLCFVTVQSIINGRDAELGEAPYQARIRFRKSPQMTDGSYRDHLCGGTLISSCWVLTASTCILTDESISRGGGMERWYRVDVGNRYYQTDVGNETDFYHQSLRVKRAIVHPRASRNSKFNDLALLQLFPSNEAGECAIFGKTVQPAIINNANDQFRSCSISGWGVTSLRSRHVPNILQIADVNITDFNQCQNNYRQRRTSLTKRAHICAAGNNGVDTCMGDTGGPLVCKNDSNDNLYLAGVTSFGIGCGQPNFPGVYVRVGSYRKWISEQIETAEPVPYDVNFVCKSAQCPTTIPTTMSTTMDSTTTWDV